MVILIMLEKLWNDISLIYEGLNFSKDSIQENLVIISKDNYYLLYQKDTTIEVRIEKDYNLVKMWSSDVSCDGVNYKIHVEVGGKVELDENYKIELAYKIITPFLREVKLTEIGI